MPDQPRDSYLALPPSGGGPGVLVLHAWWGLNDFMRSVCDRLAGEGFVALAPDLYHGRTASTIEEAKGLSSSLDEERTAAGILTALDYLSSHPAVAGPHLGVAGFSLGAYWAKRLAQQKPDQVRAVALFYGMGEDDFSTSQAAYIAHLAENDPYEEEAWIRQVEAGMAAANRPHAFYTYPGTGHWFFEEDRPEAYDPAAARLAWERTVAFLREHLSRH